MNGLELLTHIGNFLLLPLFVGMAVGSMARLFWFRQRSWIRLAVAGFLGSLIGLVAGWVVTGQDGHMLGYGLLVLLCTVFVFVAGGSSTHFNKVKNK